MSKIVVLEWVTNVTETHRAEVALDRVPKTLRDAINAGTALGDTRASLEREYLPGVEGTETLAESSVFGRELFKWSAKDE